MRTPGKLALVLGVAVLSTGLADAQQPGGGRFGGGGFGGGGFNDPATLLRSPQVREELNLTDEQLQKLPDAVMEALGKVLNGEQQKRLKQIVLQQQGVATALRRPEIQTSLNLSDEQKETINIIVEDTEKEVKSLMANAEGQARFEAFRKAGTLRTQMNDKIKEVLTSQQKQQWEDMLGKEVNLGFGGRGGLGGGRPGGQGGNNPQFRRPGGNNQQGNAPRKNDT